MKMEPGVLPFDRKKKCLLSIPSICYFGYVAVTLPMQTIELSVLRTESWLWRHTKKQNSTSAKLDLPVLHFYYRSTCTYK